MHCNRDYKVIREHQCVVRKISAVLPIDLYREIMTKDDGPTATCDGCGALHFLTKFVHGFRRYNGVDLCVDCYDIPQITKDTSTKWAQLAMMDMHMGKTVCAICTVGLIDPKAGYELAAFRREYVDVFDTQCTVFAFVKAGGRWDSIRAASERSRKLCMRCHSAVSTAKRYIGIQRLKMLQVSDGIKQMAARKVESLVYLLVFQGSNNS